MFLVYLLNESSPYYGANLFYTIVFIGAIVLTGVAFLIEAAVKGFINGIQKSKKKAHSSK